MTILSQGAEAVIELIEDKVHKKRLSKSYRNAIIDEKIRSQRTNREKKVIKRLRELNIPVPETFPTDEKYIIVMEFIDGKRLRDVLIENASKKNYLKQVGEFVRIMHDNGIIHGDLTTSNILVDKKNKLFLIDFGLSFFSDKVEDKAVDIHLLKQAIESTHYKHVEEFYSEFEKGYGLDSLSEEVFKRLHDVELRGRNKA